MAYFANGSEGACFDEECSTCRYGEDPCPIAFVQMEYNYSACNNKTATGILLTLVKDSGHCRMKEFMRLKDEDNNQKANGLVAPEAEPPADLFGSNKQVGSDPAGGDNPQPQA